MRNQQYDSNNGATSNSMPYRNQGASHLTLPQGAGRRFCNRIQAGVLLATVLHGLCALPTARGQGTDPIMIGTRKYNRTEFRVNAGGFEANQRANMAILSTRNLIVAWHENSPTDCKARIYDQQGTALSGVFVLHPYGSSGWQYGPSPAPLPNGGLVAAWGANSAAAHGQLFNSSMSPVGGEITFSSQNVWPAIASHTNGDFIVTGGTADSPVYARRFNSAGVAYGDIFQVGAFVSGWYYPSIAYGPDGRFTIAWPSGGSIQARSYQSNELSPFGPEFRVNTTNTWSCYAPSVQYNRSKELLIAWGAVGTADAQGIFVRRYGANNTAYSSETLVNENTAPSQAQPNLGIGTNNESIVSWQESSDVYARLLDANANPFGHQFLVNKWTSGSQLTAGSAGLHGCMILDNTNIVIGWAGDGASGGGVYLTMLQYLYDADIKITGQPTNRDVLVGANVTLCIAANSPEPFNYQWQFNAANIQGATNSCLLLTNVQLADAGGYQCVVSNSVVSRTSLEAVLTVRQCPRSARELYVMGYTNNGTYTVDPDGPGGQAPFDIYCLMSLSGGGWTKLTSTTANSVLNTDTNLYREYLYVKNNTTLWYRSPLCALVWSWSSGKDLYGTYFYSSGGGEASFNVTSSGEHQLYGVGGSSGPYRTTQCVIYYWNYYDPANAQTYVCQDIPGIFGGACAGPVTVYIRESATTNQWPLVLTATPTNGGVLTGSGSYLDGMRVTISAAPTSGYRFAYWAGEAIENTNAPTTTVLITGPRNISAHFVKTWHLDMAEEPAGSGLVTGSGDYDDGIYATITAEADWTSWFLGWTGGGVADTNAEVTTVLMDRDRQVTGFFAAPDLQVTQVSAPSNAIAGHLVQMSWTITNSGIASAYGDWSDRALLSPDNQIGGDSAIATNPVSTIIFPGDSITRVQNILIPAGFVGSYWVVAEANYDRGVAEVTHANNLGISSHPIIITPTPYPNLQIAAVYAASNTFAGQQTEARWVVTNTGPQSTGSAQWEDAVYLSTDTQWDTSDTFLGSTLNPTALGPNQVYSSSLLVTIPRRTQGTYYLIVRADFRNRVNEGGLDGDNAGPSNPMQVALPGWPDLRVASVFTPYEAFSGQPATVTWVVTNAGTWATDEASWNDRIYLSTTTNLSGVVATLASFPRSGSLPVGQGYTNSQEVTLPVGISGTNFYLLVQADADNQAWEWVFENNNLGAPTHPTWIHLTPPPDLEVVSISNLSSICAGFELPVSYRVANNGANDTPNYSWQDAFYLSTDTNFDAYADTYLGYVTHYGQLPRTNFYDATASVRIPQNVSGNRYLIAVADWQNVVFELDKTNNHRASAAPVNILPLADLQVTSVVVPSSALSGFDFPVVYQVTNTGPCATIASSWSDSFYLSANPTLSFAAATLLGTAGHSGQLASGGSYDGTNTLRLPLGLSGDYYVFVATDSQGKVPEQNENNNTARVTFPLNLQLPSNDLLVLSVGAPLNALAGFNVTVTSVVANQGTNAIPNSSWQDAFYLSADQTLSTNDVLLGEVTHTVNLPAGAAYTNSLTARIPDCLAGQFFILVATDSRAEVFEQNETNNVASSAPVTIVSQPSDLIVQSCKGPSGTFIAGSSVSVDWTVRNAGSGQTTVDSWSDQVVMSRDDIFGNADDVSLGLFPHSGVLITNGSYASTQSVTIPGATTAGTYALFIQTDAARQAYECGAETNNVCLASHIAVIRPNVDLVVSSVTMTNEAWSGQNLAVSWTVQNLGNSAASPSSWSDYVYLSRDQQIGTNAILLGTASRSGGLLGAASYTATNEYSLPWDAQGDYYVIVRADGAGQVPEAVEDNNDAAGSAQVHIFLSRTPDLLVTAISVPAQATSGQPMPISWAVLNNGAPTTQHWYDAVYLSYDQILDRGSDIYLGYAEHTGGLDEGSIYTVTQSFDLPRDLYGPVYVFVVADSRNIVYERQAEDNNIGRSSVVNVDLAPLSDLVVTDVNPPASLIMVGQTNTVAYTVLNQSANSVNGRWEDSIYLSADPGWDITDTLLGKVTVNRSLGPWETYSGSLTAQMPGVLPGHYYAIVRADIRNYIPESDEGNNIGVSSQTFPIDIVELTLGVPYTNDLFTGKEDFYKVNAPSNQTLSVTLGTFATNGFNELFTRFADVPNRAQYDFGYSNPFAPDQQVIVPNTQAGYYFNLVRGHEVPTPPTKYTVEAETVPFGIKSVSPLRIGDNGQVTITIKGARFQPGAIVGLQSGNITLSPSRISVLNSITAKAKFNLTNALHGAYQLWLRNPDTASVTGTIPVVVESAVPAYVTLETIGNLAPRIGRPLETPSLVFNPGNIDAEVVSVIATFNQNVRFGWKRPLTSVPRQDFIPGADWLSASPTAGFYDGNTSDGFTVFDMAPGESVAFSAVVSGFSDGPFAMRIVPLVQSHDDFAIDLSANIEYLRQYVLRNPSSFNDEFIALAGTQEAWNSYHCSLLLALGYTDTCPLRGLAGNAYAKLDGRPIVCGQQVCDEPAHQDCKDRATEEYGQCYLKNWTNPEKFLECTAKYYADLFKCDKEHCGYHGWCFKCVKGKWITVVCDSGCSGGEQGCGEPPRIVDPNEKIGPSGYGSSAFVGRLKPLQYSVNFENLTNATGIAQKIAITDLLGEELDPRTVILHTIAFGTNQLSIPANQGFYQTRLVLNSNLHAEVTGLVDVQSRQIRWTLRAIDPATGEPPESAQVGLLPPNDATHRGEGYVTYTVLPVASVQTGAVITNSATIVFDNNEPIETAPVWNTIDTGAPTSSVAALPSFSPTNFPVCWSGTDDTGGSGVQGYDLYVSDNSGPHQLWLANTPDNCAVYSGQSGHAYAFYSLGRDNAGNVESPPDTPDAFTTVISNSPPVLAAIADRTVNVGQTVVITSNTSDPDVPPQTLTFSLLPGAPPEARFNSTNGVFRWTPSFAYGTTTNVIGIVVCDNGTPSMCTTQTFKVMVTDIIVTELDTLPLPVGHRGCVPLTLFASTGVTNLSFCVVFPPARLTNVDLTVLPEIGTGIKYGEGLTNACFEVFPPPGHLLISNVNVGQLCFTVVSNQPSSFLSLLVASVQGRKPDGTLVTNIVVQPGRVVAIGAQPLLEAIRGTNGQPVVVLYGMIGTNYVVLSTLGLEGVPLWQTNWQGTNAGFREVIEPVVTTNRTMFFRALRP